MVSHVYIDLVKESVRINADRPCLHVKRNGTYQTWTFREFGDQVERLSAYLRSQGITRGSNVALIGPNIPEWVIAHHGTMFAGACVVPIDPNLSPQEIAEIVRLTDPQAIFCTAVFVPFFRQLSAENRGPKQIIGLDTQSEPEVVPITQATAFQGPQRSPLEFTPDDPCAIIFTSGTTGKAKGAVLLQRNFTAVPNYGARRMHVTANDTMGAVLPLHHVFGFAGCITSSIPTGMDIVFMPVVKGPLILEALNDKHITLLLAVPQMLELFYDTILRKVKTRGPAVALVFSLLRLLSFTLGPMLGPAFRRKLFTSIHAGFGGNLRAFVSGGSSLKKRYFDGFRQLGFQIVEGYGLTETFGPITLCPIDNPRQGSVGPVFPENELRIENPDVEMRGEVLFRGLTVFGGYYNNQAATEAVFDREGWFHTGDLGRVSKDGFLFLTGRSKDLIVLDSGKNVYPDELEEFYSASPLIEEIGVVGVQQDGSETVGAVIIPSADIRRKYSSLRIADLLQEEIIRLGRNLPSYKKLGTFVISLSPLPRTSTRKIIKPEVRTIFDRLQKSGGIRATGTAKLSFFETAMIDTPEYAAILEIVMRLSRTVAPDLITPRSHLEFDLQIDSLKKLDLVSAIEQQYNISIPVDEITRQETLGALVAFVQDRIAATASDSAASGPTVKEHIASLPVASLVQGNHGVSLRLAAAVVRLVSRASWRTRWQSDAQSVDNGSLIYACNHQSLLDGPWVFAGLPDFQRRRTFVVGKAELTGVPILSVLFKRWHMIPVDRGGNVVTTLATSLAVLRAGNNLVLFPEGTRSLDGIMGSFKSGVGTLMLETEAKVVPVHIKGSRAVWPKGKLPAFGRRTTPPPEVHYGVPVSVQDLIAQELVSPTPNAAGIAQAVRKLIEAL